VRLIFQPQDRIHGVIPAQSGIHICQPCHSRAGGNPFVLSVAIARSSHTFVYGKRWTYPA
jgi:hypothetical protein